MQTGGSTEDLPPTQADRSGSGLPAGRKGLVCEGTNEASWGHRQALGFQCCHKVSLDSDLASLVTLRTARENQIEKKNLFDFPQTLRP